MSKAVLFRIIKIQKPRKGPSADEWVNKMRPSRVMKYYSAIKTRMRYLMHAITSEA